MPIKSFYRKLFKTCRAPFASILTIKNFPLPGAVKRLRNIPMTPKLIQSLDHFHLEGRVLDTTANYRINVKEEADQDRSA